MAPALTHLDQLVPLLKRLELCRRRQRPERDVDLAGEIRAAAGLFVNENDEPAFPGIRAQMSGERADRGLAIVLLAADDHVGRGEALPLRRTAARLRAPGRRAPDRFQLDSRIALDEALQRRIERLTLAALRRAPDHEMTRLAAAIRHGHTLPHVELHPSLAEREVDQVVGGHHDHRAPLGQEPSRADNDLDRLPGEETEHFDDGRPRGELQRGDDAAAVLENVDVELRDRGERWIQRLDDEFGGQPIRVYHDSPSAHRDELTRGVCENRREYSARAAVFQAFELTVRVVFSPGLADLVEVARNCRAAYRCFRVARINASM